MRITNNKSSLILILITIFGIGFSQQVKAQEVLTKVGGGASWQNINQALIGARVELSTHFDVAQGVAFQQVPFDNEVYDQGNNYDNTTGGSEYFEAPSAGFYRIDYSLGIIFNGSNMGNRLDLIIQKDPFSGAQNATLARNVATGIVSSTDPSFQMSGSLIISAAQGDRFWLEANRTGSNGTISIANSTNSHLTFTKL